MRPEALLRRILAEMNTADPMEQALGEREARAAIETFHAEVQAAARRRTAELRGREAARRYAQVVPMYECRNIRQLARPITHLLPA